MTTIESTSQVPDQPGTPFTLDEDHLAALAFPARYSGRTLEAYRHDLRALFQWAADHGLAVLTATRTHLEVYRAAMEERGTGGFDHRPATLHSLRFLPICPH
jgi:site-specific recombinase XerD